MDLNTSGNVSPPYGKLRIFKKEVYYFEKLILKFHALINKAHFLVTQIHWISNFRRISVDVLMMHYYPQLIKSFIITVCSTCSYNTKDPSLN